MCFLNSLKASSLLIKNYLKSKFGRLSYKKCKIEMPNAINGEKNRLQYMPK